MIKNIPEINHRMGQSCSECILHICNKPKLMLKYVTIWNVCLRTKEQKLVVLSDAEYVTIIWNVHAIRRTEVFLLSVMLKVATLKEKRPFLQFLTRNHDISDMKHNLKPTCYSSNIPTTPVQYSLFHIRATEIVTGQVNFTYTFILTE